MFFIIKHDLKRPTEALKRHAEALNHDMKPTSLRISTVVASHLVQNLEIQQVLCGLGLKALKHLSFG